VYPAHDDGGGSVGAAMRSRRGPRAFIYRAVEEWSDRNGMARCVRRWSRRYDV
jgi:hypothetical protein